MKIDVNVQGKIAIEIYLTFIIRRPDWDAVFHKNLSMHKNMKNHRFLVQWRHGKLYNQAIGNISISIFPQKIASSFELPKVETFTGHASRRTYATLLADNGHVVLQLKRLGKIKLDCSHAFLFIQDYRDAQCIT
ncbi:hypothetical protein JTB14_009882 [Gonioctena quinquepunctata]|nr:hypothetical protein JTB14_009882 [Gonioctena quinquepunctata]